MIFTSGPFFLAQQFHRMGDLTAAEALYRELLSAQPDHAELHHLLGVSLYQQGKIDEGKERVRHSLGLETAATPLANLATILHAEGDNQEARECIQLALELEPDNLDHRLTLAVILRAQGESRSAWETLRRGIDLDPGWIEGRVALALAHWDSGETQQAVAEAERILSLDHECAAARGLLEKAGRRVVPESGDVMLRLVSEQDS